MKENLHSLLSQQKVFDHSRWFSEIASELFFNFRFQIKDNLYDIYEIEFYSTDDIHHDPFTHKNDEQNTSSKFYFHKRGNSFQEGSIKGLDITCGSSERAGGILIRGIKNIETGEYIDGPGNVVQKILDTFKVAKVKDFADLKPSSIFEGKISLKPHHGSKKCKIIWTPRVGLSLKKHIDLRLEYITKEYRALRIPIESRKGLRWIRASAIVNHHDLDLKSRSSSITQIKELLDRGSSSESINELLLSSKSGENDYLKLYGFLKKKKT